MIELLYPLIFSEMVVILVLLFRTPLRNLLIVLLDKLKRGKGQIVASTVAVTVLVVFVSRVYTQVQIARSVSDPLAVNPTDQVMMAWGMLETSLMGFALFLALMIDRLHHYIRELDMLRKALKVTKQQSRAANNMKSGEVLKVLKEDTASLRANMGSLESDREEKVKEAKATKAEVDALKKQSEGLNTENQNLQSQLQSADKTLSSSDEKKSL
ncbi:hypothetical protein SAY87_020286 [Trapa incisa]|uniref:Endoplasmic reticulum transmembrane protein n=1 Tax=Trapa incisa TaxID=236973 RepID=A0AAN7K1B4_9MYRT|nr:hypothetical protein SAY87_020286 [Trapa incisa]